MEKQEQDQYPQSETVYTVQYQEHRKPDIWWDARAQATSDLDEALALKAALENGTERPRGNPRASVAKARVAMAHTTTSIIIGEGAPGPDPAAVNERGETFEEAWARYFAQHPHVLASWNHQNGRWPEGN
ncbi:hypothetical protein ACWD7M_16375 [Streptomyces griseus]